MIALVVGLVVACSACVTSEAPWIIVPAKMGAHPSLRNHRQGQTYVFAENGTLATRVRFRSVRRWGLSITARAEGAGDGPWPRLRVELDGVPPKTIVVGDRLPIPYWSNFASEPGFADLRLSLINGATTGAGPVLVIERVELVPL